GNMLRWGSMSARIAIRGLNARERSNLVEPHPGQRRCTLSLAARPGENTWICIIDGTGGYECPLVTSDGMPPLRNKNGTTDRRLRLPRVDALQPLRNHPAFVRRDALDEAAAIPESADERT